MTPEGTADANSVPDHQTPKISPPILTPLSISPFLLHYLSFFFLNPHPKIYPLIPEREEAR